MSTNLVGSNLYLRSIHFGLIFLFSLFLSICSMLGCTSKGSIQVQKSSSHVAQNYKILSVDIKSQVNNVDEALFQLDNSIVGQLRDMDLFERVYSVESSTKEESDLKLNVVVTRVRKVSSVARFWAGAFAGRGAIEANVELVDGKNSEILAQAKAEGKTSGGFSSAGTTPQAVQRLAEQIVAFVAEHSGRTSSSN